MKMQSLSSLFSHSPSLDSTCSSSFDKPKQIVAHQSAPQNNNSTGRFLLQDAFIKDDADQLVSNSNQQQQQHCSDANLEDEFEFEFALASVLSPVPADQIFYNGQIRPLYPHFKVENNNVVSRVIPRAARLPLRKLFVEERELDTSASSCSSSVTDELEVDDSPEFCDKGSNFIRRWKFRDFLQKSNRSGKNSLPELPDINRLCNKLCK